MKINQRIQVLQKNRPKVTSDESYKGQCRLVSESCNTYKFSELNNNTYTLYNIESKIKIAGAR